MNYEAEQIIDQGKELLAKNVFPGDLIEAIREERLRKHVSQEIFIQAIPFEDVNENEKKRRRSLLAVQLAFIDYLSAKKRFRPAIVIIFIIGFITFVTAYIKMNYNLEIGALTMIEAGVLYLISYSYKYWTNALTYICGAFVLSLIIEYLIFGWPDTFMSFMYRSPHFEVAMDNFQAGGSATVFLDESSPWIYFLVKSSFVYYCLRLFVKRKKYLERKEDFELSR